LGALNGSLHLVSEARLGDVQLLVTELITNAVRHGGGATVDVGAYADAATLRVEVASVGASFDPHAATDAEARAPRSATAPRAAADPPRTTRMRDRPARPRPSHRCHVSADWSVIARELSSTASLPVPARDVHFAL
jgi:hypothetical protein